LKNISHSGGVSLKRGIGGKIRIRVRQTESFLVSLNSPSVKRLALELFKSSTLKCFPVSLNSPSVKRLALELFKSSALHFLA
jgi:hypothetical protein